MFEAKRLKKEETSADEITGLVGVGERRIRDPQVEAISEDLRFIAAYNAILTSATIALRATGYRVGSQPGHHVLTLETLQYTTAANDSLIRKLKAFAAQRGRATYDVAGSVSADQLPGVVRAAQELERMVLDRLRQHHPHLLAR